MDEPSKIQALPLSVVRERLCSRRHDTFVAPHRPPNPSPAPVANAPAPKTSPPPIEEKICAYSKCGVKFTPRRPDQHYHSADCRKRAWFDRNFAPIAKTEAR